MHYSVAGETHDMVVRTVRGTTVTPGTVATKVNNFLVTLQDIIYDDFTVLSWQWALEDSIFFNDFTADTTFTGLASSAGRSVTARTVQTRWEGRSAFGGKTAIVLFGLNWNLVADTEFTDFRKTPAESAEIGLSLTALASVPIFACGDGFPTTWKQYVNVKMNDASVKKARGG